MQKLHSYRRFFVVSYLNWLYSPGLASTVCLTSFTQCESLIRTKRVLQWWSSDTVEQSELQDCWFCNSELTSLNPLRHKDGIASKPALLAYGLHALYVCAPYAAWLLDPAHVVKRQYGPRRAVNRCIPYATPRARKWCLPSIIECLTSN